MFFSFPLTMLQALMVTILNSLFLAKDNCSRHNIVSQVYFPLLLSFLRHFSIIELLLSSACVDVSHRSLVCICFGIYFDIKSGVMQEFRLFFFLFFIFYFLFFIFYGSILSSPKASLDSGVGFVFDLNRFRCDLCNNSYAWVI